MYSTYIYRHKHANNSSPTSLAYSTFFNTIQTLNSSVLVYHPHSPAHAIFRLCFCSFLPLRCTITDWVRHIFLKVLSVRSSLPSTGKFQVLTVFPPSNRNRKFQLVNDILFVLCGNCGKQNDMFELWYVLLLKLVTVGFHISIHRSVVKDIWQDNFGFKFWEKFSSTKPSSLLPFAHTHVFLEVSRSACVDNFLNPSVSL